MNPEMHHIIKADPTDPDIPIIPFGEIKIPEIGFDFLQILSMLKYIYYN